MFSNSVIRLLVNSGDDGQVHEKLVLVPCPINDDNVCASELSFLNHSADERIVPEDFIFVSGPRF